MPLILGVIVLFLYICMFCHDRCVMEYVCRTACEAAVYDMEGTGGVEETLADRISGELTNRLISRWDTDISIDEDDECITAHLEAKTALFPGTVEHTGRAYRHFRPKY